MRVQPIHEAGSLLATILHNGDRAGKGTAISGEDGLCLSMGGWEDGDANDVTSRS